MSDSEERDEIVGTDATVGRGEVTRPFGVAVVLVLAWVAAIGDIVAGIVLLLLSFDHARFTDDTVSASLVRYFGLVAIVIGLLTAMVALGLANGSQFARVFTIMVMVVRMVNAAWALIAIRYVTLWPAVFDLAIAVLITALLSNRAASDYFRRRART